MSLMNEALARAHCRDFHSEAVTHQRVRRILVARKLERRAARAAMRARRLAAAAVAASSRAGSVL